MRTAILAAALLLAISTTNAADQEGTPSVRIADWAIPDGFHGLATSTTNATDKGCLIVMEGHPSVRITGWGIPDGFHGLVLGPDSYKMKSISSECLFEDNIIRNVTVLFQEKETK